MDLRKRSLAPIGDEAWEFLEESARGALDADVSALEEAAKRIAVFEERAVYEGLDQVAEHRMKPSGDSLVGAIAAATSSSRSDKTSRWASAAPTASR